MSLSSQQKKQFRTIGHNLNPVVTVAAKGLSDTVLDEIHRALKDHELIKIKLIAERASKAELIASICEQTGAEQVQSIGNVVLLFKLAKKRNAKLSNLTNP